ncbi:GEM-interacting protein, partial [Buceros rhinoceros silvestris]
GLDNQERPPENRKRYSEIFRGLDAIEISIGNAYVEKRGSTSIPGPSWEPQGVLGTSTSFLGPSWEPHKSKADAERPAPADMTVQEADEMLIKCEGGIEAALE